MPDMLNSNTPERSCTKCGKPARYVAADELGLEWFECGDHGPLDNLAEVERVSLTPIDDWFRDNGILLDFADTPSEI